MKLLKHFKNTIFYTLSYKCFCWLRETKALILWKYSKQSGSPPHSIKQHIIKDYAKHFNIKVFVETGTYTGDMINAVKNYFSIIYSVELSKQLYQRASQRFRKNKNIMIVYGNSIEALPSILTNINQPTLFWLDAHYSGGNTAKAESETPIINELNLILNHKSINHVILIDDARCFIGKNDYPTINMLKNYILKIDNSWIIEIEMDIIRLYKKKDKSN